MDNAWKIYRIRISYTPRPQIDKNIENCISGFPRSFFVGIRVDKRSIWLCCLNETVVSEQASNSPEARRCSNQISANDSSLIR